MESIAWFGHWLRIYWFVRWDGAWFLRFNFPGKRPYTVYSGITMPRNAPPRVAGYFYLHDEQAIVALIRVPGSEAPLVHPLGFVPLSPRLERWVDALGR
jgi:hypothetical protein